VTYRKYVVVPLITAPMMHPRYPHLHVLLMVLTEYFELGSQLFRRFGCRRRVRQWRAVGPGLLRRNEERRLAYHLWMIKPITGFDPDECEDR